jgi:hypothetical protein
MLNSVTKSVQLNSEIIDVLIGYDDHQKNESKQLKSKRVLQARRAIEQHREKQQLCQDIDNYWLLD